MSLGATYYRDQLTKINAAIDAVEGRNQSYSIEGRSLSRADLGELYKERQRLEPLALREASGGGRSTVDGSSGRIGRSGVGSTGVVASSPV